MTLSTPPYLQELQVILLYTCVVCGRFTYHYNIPHSYTLSYLAHLLVMLTGDTNNDGENSLSDGQTYINIHKGGYLVVKVNIPSPEEKIGQTFCTCQYHQDMVVPVEQWANCSSL